MVCYAIIISHLLGKGGYDLFFHTHCSKHQLYNFNISLHGIHFNHLLSCYLMTVLNISSHYYKCSKYFNDSSDYNLTHLKPPWIYIDAM